MGGFKLLSSILFVTMEGVDFFECNKIYVLGKGNDFFECIIFFFVYGGGWGKK
jgi:hypothetical protein